MRLSKTKIWIIPLVLSAILVGFFYVVPQILIWKNLSEQGRIFLSPNLDNASDVTQAYLPRAREVYDGHFPPADLSLGSAPSLLPPLPALLMAGFIWLFSGNVPAAYLGVVFFFGAVIFLLFYALGRTLTGSRLWSLLLAFSGVFTSIALINNQLFTNLERFLSILVKNFYPLVNTPIAALPFLRIDDPLLTYPIYLSAILFLFLFWQKPKLWNAVLSGALIGLLAYTYFHYWVYLTIAVGLLFGYSLFNAKKNPARFKFMLILLGALILVLIPYAINYFRFTGLDSSAEYTARIWVEVGGNFRFSRIYDYLAYIAVATLVYFSFKKDRTRRDFFLILIAAMFVVWNIQLITGYSPHPYHFWKAVSPILFLIVFNAIFVFFAKYEHRKVAMVLILLIALLLTKKAVNAYQFLNPSEDILNSYSMPVELVESWQWINNNLEREPVIISPSYTTSFYLYSYTSARPFLPPSLNTLASNAELEKRFLIANKLFGVSKKTVEERLRRIGVGSSESAQQIYGNYFVDNSFDIEHRDNLSPQLKKWFVPEEKISELLDVFANLKVIFADTGARYVYYGPWEKQFSQLDFKRTSELELVFENSEVSIYRIAQ